MLVADLKERMSAEEFFGWNLYYKRLNESRDDDNPKSGGNLLDGSIGGLIGLPWVAVPYLGW